MIERKKSNGIGSGLPLPLPIIIIILIACASYKYILPLKVEVVGSPAGYFVPFNDTNHVVIEDFFKPYDPSSPKSVPTSAYYRSINLRPIAAHRISRNNFSLWLEEQTSISFEKILANIGNSNINDLHKNDNVADGAVIASISKNEPDYFYQWPRDAAITINTIVANLIGSDNAINLTLAETVTKYLNNSAVLQRTSNPSGEGVGGNDPNLKGLGEPKFEVNNEAFKGNWGRPQNDGAPLRLIATFHFLGKLNQQNVSLSELISQLNTDGHQNAGLLFDDEKSLFNNVIRHDLEFVSKNWQTDSFDLWEEIKGRHFFTSLVQLSATKLGLEFMGNHEPNDPLFKELQETFNGLYEFLTLEGGFLNPHKNYIVETPSSLNTRSGLDTAVLIASLLTHDKDAEPFTTNNLPFDVTDSGILNTLHALTNVMAIIYPINHQRHSPNMGVALGRYPEDIYDGVGTSEGNPWFLCTSNAAQLFYQIIRKMYDEKTDLDIPVNTWESKFWTLIFEGFETYPSILPSNYYNDNDIKNNDGSYHLIIPYNSPAFNQTMISLLNYGDSFLDKLREHVSDDGSMNEQFNKYTGIMQGAKELTWSHGAFWSSSHLRRQILPLFSN